MTSEKMPRIMATMRPDGKTVITKNGRVVRIVITPKSQIRAKRTPLHWQVGEEGEQ